MENSDFVNLLEVPRTPEAGYPCWLSQSQLEEAQALLEQGFIYCGNVDDFDESGWLCGRVGTWQFYWPPGCVHLDAICNGALYSRCLETEPQYRQQDWIESQLKLAKSAIRKVKNLRKKKQPLQLKLFEV